MVNSAGSVQSLQRSPFQTSTSTSGVASCSALRVSSRWWVSFHTAKRASSDEPSSVRTDFHALSCRGDEASTASVTVLMCRVEPCGRPSTRTRSTRSPCGTMPNASPDAVPREPSSASHSTQPRHSRLTPQTTSKPSGRGAITTGGLVTSAPVIVRPRG
ncbi:hypothetical protein D3C74_356800 [compost metagenome]